VFMLLFALNTSAKLGHAVADAAGIQLAPHEEREFAGGEHKTRPLQSVRGMDVYVLQSLNGDANQTANDKLCRLLFFIAACRENGAARVTAIVPYLAYSRKDRQTKARDPVTTRYVAMLFEAVGTDCVVTIDVHNLQAFQNAFRCSSLNLETASLFSAEISKNSEKKQLVVFSPDAGGIKRAQLLREKLSVMTGADIGFGFMEKRRSSGVVSGDLFAGDIEGRSVWIVDDMIVGGGTMLRAALACHDRGAKEVHLAATHAMFEGDAVRSLGCAEITSVTLTDSAADPMPAAEMLGERLRILSVAPTIAKAILHLHSGVHTFRGA